MNSSSYEAINAILRKFQITPEVIDHPSVFTCEEADGYTPHPENGVKSILLKGKHDYIIIVIPGNKRVSIEKVKRITSQKRISFAKTDDAIRITGAQEGAIPPFGHEQKIPILVDETIKKFSSIYFNPGINTQTYGLTNDDLLKVFENMTQFVDIIEK